MTWINWLLIGIASSAMAVFQTLTYGRLSNEKVKITLLNVLLFMIGGVIITYNSYSVDTALRAFISYATLLSIEMIIFKDNIYRSISYGTVSYLLVVISEIILDIILLGTKLISLNDIDSNVFIKIFYSIIFVLPAFFLAKLQIFKRLAFKIETLLYKSIIWIGLIVICLAGLIIIAFKNVIAISFSSYITDLILLILFLILIVIAFYNDQKAKKEIENTKILLDFMAQYEKKIDEDRINRHEMLNNLLILKSYKDKNSEKYNNTLNDIIDLYNKKSIGIKNINKLPSGLKGIIYYKINAIKNAKANISINISKQLSTTLENMNYKTYAMLCKVVGITVDNAIEAAIKSKEKIISIDIYENNDFVIIEIDNSFSNKVDMKKINNKNYTTKGVNRGLGLYIVKSIIRTNKNISINQEIVDKLFITKIQIKNLDI